MLLPAPEEGKDRHWFIAGLIGHPGEIERSRIEPGRRARLEPSDPKTQIPQPGRKLVGRRVAHATAPVILHAHVDTTSQESTHCQNHAWRAKVQADLRPHPGHAVTLHHEIGNRLLKDAQIGLIFQGRTDDRAIQGPIRLGAGSAHRRTLAGVESSKMDAGQVGGSRHQAAQRVDFLDQMSLANAANRRVATHLPQRFDILRQQQNLTSGSRGGQSSLGPGMPSAHNDHIKLLGKKHLPCQPQKPSRRAFAKTMYITPAMRKPEPPPPDSRG